MLTSCSIDFPYTALVYSNEPPGPNAFLFPMHPYGIDLPYADHVKGMPRKRGGMHGTPAGPLG